MIRSQLWLLPAAAVAIAAPTVVQATTYLTVSQAQALMFPRQILTPVFLTLTDDQVKQIEQDAGVNVLTRQVRAWRSADGGWFLADQVYGKSDLIAYAVALDAKGRILQVEILSYQESRGDEVRLPAWRAQFIGKHHANPVRLDDDIRNISGATISCRHVTEGIRRLLSTWALILAPLPNFATPTAPPHG